MVNVSQIQDDLQFVRQSISKRQSRGPIEGPYYAWAVYALIGYALIDFAPHYANAFFGIAWIPAAIVSGILVRRAKAIRGEVNRAFHGKLLMHWLGGCVLAVACSIGLALAIPDLQKGIASGQVSLVLIGMVYFLAGVHIDRSFLVLGPIVMICGIVVGFIPHYGFTIVGVIFALGLVLAGLAASRGRVATSVSQSPANPQS
jgi:hypothetical protein